MFAELTCSFCINGTLRRKACGKKAKRRWQKDVMKRLNRMRKWQPGLQETGRQKKKRRNWRKRQESGKGYYAGRGWGLWLCFLYGDWFYQPAGIITDW